MCRGCPGGPHGVADRQARTGWEHPPPPRVPGQRSSAGLPDTPDPPDRARLPLLGAEERRVQGFQVRACLLSLPWCIRCQRCSRGCPNHFLWGGWGGEDGSREQDPFAEPARPNIGRLSNLFRLACPSTTPVFQGGEMPARERTPEDRRAWIRSPPRTRRAVPCTRTPELLALHRVEAVVSPVSFPASASLSVSVSTLAYNRFPGSVR
jgi:ferredoxin